MLTVVRSSHNGWNTGSPLTVGTAFTWTAPLSRSKQKDNVFLEIAALLGTLGTCDRAYVGAVVVKDGRCVTWGYNGAPSGLPHCDENDHGWREVFEPPSGQQKMQALEMMGCRNATHAEVNALAYAARQGISTEGGTLYVERSPCIDCARLLISAGISRVVYSVEYRDPAGVDLLRKAGVQVG